MLRRRFGFPVLNNFSETPCIKVGWDVRISLVRVLSAGGGAGGTLPPNVSSLAKKVSFLPKNLKLFQILILFDGDNKEYSEGY